MADDATSVMWPKWRPTGAKSLVSLSLVRFHVMQTSPAVSLDANQLAGQLVVWQSHLDWRRIGELNCYRAARLDAQVRAQSRWRPIYCPRTAAAAAGSTRNGGAIYLLVCHNGRPKAPN